MKYIIVMLCSLFLLTMQQSGFAASPLSIGTWKTAQTIQPFFYAKYLPEQQLTIIPFTNPADQKTALLAGNLAMTGTTLAHAIFSASIGQPVVVVAALCNRCSALVVERDSTIQQVADLKGKKIGYVPGTMHEILLREALQKAGLAANKDVQLTRIDFFDMGTALAKGDIAAFLSGEPFPTLAVAKGYGRILSYPYFNESVGTINAGMLVTRKSIEEDPERVYSLVHAHAQATHYLQTHREIWLQKAAEFGTPLEILEKASGNMELSWDMDAHFVQQAKNLGARMQDLGIITQQPDYDTLFDLEFVKRVEKEL